MRKKTEYWLISDDTVQKVRRVLLAAIANGRTRQLPDVVYWLDSEICVTDAQPENYNDVRELDEYRKRTDD